jgi:hypothetical protein
MSLLGVIQVKQSAIISAAKVAPDVGNMTLGASIAALGIRQRMSMSESRCCPNSSLYLINVLIPNIWPQ